MTVTVQGADTLARTMAKAADEIANMDRAAEAAGRAVVSRSRPPVRTGALLRSVRASATSEGVDMASSLIYAPVIHNGWAAHNIRANPFLRTALEAATRPIVDRYSADVSAAMAGVRGA